jgi:hypothetical protein
VEQHGYGMEHHGNTGGGGGGGSINNGSDTSVLSANLNSPGYVTITKL